MDEDIARAYAHGTTRFMDMDLLVAPGALVPRKETELLGRTAIDLLRGMDDPAALVIDMCCGTGNLACAIAVHVPESSVWASDVSATCIAVARRNVELYALNHRVHVRLGDLFAAFAADELGGRVDLVVCNPPYISDSKLQGERANLLELEPREAFAAGPYGIGIHQRVVREAFPLLKPGGALLFEVGAGQERQVSALFTRSGHYEDVRVVQDSTGIGRVVHARRKN